MRNFAAITIAVLPLVLAHVSPLERRSHHAQVGRQLIPILDDDTSACCIALQAGPKDSSAVPTSSTSVRSSTTTREPITSAISTSSAASSSTVRPITLPPVSTPSGISTTSAMSTSSGSASRNVSTSGISPSANVTASTSLNTTSTALTSSSSTLPSSVASATQVIHTSVDEGGRVVIVTQYYTPSAVPSQAAATSSPASEKKDGPALPTGAIIGISIAIGLVILALVGCALWRMKRRAGDEDEAIRWPELNRHGDSDAHHALPARATGKHGIETNELERSISNSSEVYMSQAGGPGGRPASMPMALNGSNFGATSSLDYEYEKDVPDPAANSHAHAMPLGYDYHHAYPSSGAPSSQAYDQDDYSSFPPAVGMQPMPSQGGAGQGLYESDSEGDHGAPRKAGEGPPVYRA